MTEGRHDPDKSELLRGTRMAKRPFRPFRALFRLLTGLAVTLGLLFGLTLLVARTAGFRELLARRIAKGIGAPVEISGAGLAPDMTVVLRDVRLPHLLPQARCEIGEIRFIPDPARSRAGKTLHIGRVDLRDVSLHVMETRAGIREPLALTAPLGLGTWRPPQTKPTGLRPMRDAISAPAASPADSGAKPPIPPPEPVRVPGWKPFHFRLEDTVVSIRNLRIVLHDEAGFEQAVFEDMHVGIDPGLDPLDGRPHPARYRVDGKYRILANHMPAQALHLEWINEDGTWILLRLEAERRLLFWITRVLSGESAGPLAARQPATPETDGAQAFPSADLLDPWLVPGTNGLDRRDDYPPDPVEDNRILREFLETDAMSGDSAAQPSQGAAPASF